MSPNREKPAANDSSANGSDMPSPTVAVTPVIPSRAARAWSWSIMSREKSIADTRYPARAAARAASRPGRNIHNRSARRDAR